MAVTDWSATRPYVDHLNFLLNSDLRLAMAVKYWYTIQIGVLNKVYGRFAHKDDPLQVSTGRPAPTINSTRYVKHQNIVYTCIIIICIICIILLAVSQVDFVNNTLCAIFPQIYVVVTCNSVQLIYICIFHKFAAETKSVWINSLWWPS